MLSGVLMLEPRRVDEGNITNWITVYHTRFFSYVCVFIVVLRRVSSSLRWLLSTLLPIPMVIFNLDPSSTGTLKLNRNLDVC